MHLEIFDVPLFFKAVTEQLKLDGLATTLLHLGPCAYRNREEHHSVETRLHPAIVKAPEYWYQREVRAIWQPAGSKIEPVVMEIPGVRPAVRLLKRS